MRSPTVFILLLLLACMHSPWLKAQSDQNSVFLNEDMDRIEIAPRLAMLEDAEGKLSINEVSTQAYIEQFAKPLGEGVPTFGFTPSVYWAKVHLKNNTVQDRSWWLEFDYPLADNLEVYIERLEGGFELKTSGDALPYRERELLVPNFVFALDLAAGEEVTLYVRQQTSSSMAFPLILWTPSSYTEHTSDAQIAMGLFYGTMLVMLLYNLFLFFSLKSKAYIYYICSIASIVGFQATMNGVGYMYIWSEAIWFNARAVSIWLALLGICLLTFTRTFLGMKNYAPTLNKIIIGLTALDTVNLIISLFLPYSVSIKIAIALGLSVIIFCFVSGFIVWRKGFKPARFFLLAWTVFLVGMFLQALRSMGVIPTNLITSYSAQLGSMLEVVLLSIALADRINTLQQTIRENEIEQERLKRQKEEEKKMLIEKQKEELEDQVKERTKELQERTVEVEEKNEELGAALEEIEKINRKTTDSIKYAQRIQQTILPTDEKLDRFIPNHFILYEPRDIVSGDFYWASMVKSSFVMVVADCTGHGVPGALMSMIGNTILDQIINKNEVTQPSEILIQLHDGVEAFLRQDQEGATTTRDGMDVSLISLNFKERKLLFAGAKNSLVYVQDDKLSEIRGDKFSIGGGQNRQQVCFTDHELPLEPGLKVYLFTDGYIDQFGGQSDKRFSKRRLRDLIQENHHLSPEEQKEVYLHAFLEWKGKQQQIDDV